MDFYDNLGQLAQDSKKNKLKRIFQSASIAYIACIASVLMLQSVQYAFYIISDITAEFGIIQHNFIQQDNQFWSKPKVLLIFGVPPVILFLSGLFIYILLWYNSKKISLFRFFAIWLSFFMIGITSSHLLFSPVGLESYHSVFYFGYSVVGAWLFIPFLMMAGFTFAGLVISTFFGTKLFREFMKFGYSSKAANNQKKRLIWIIEVVIIPFMIATALFVFTLNRGEDIVLLLVYLSSCLFIIGGMILKSQVQSGLVRVKKGDILSKSYLISFVLMAIMFVVVRMYFIS